MLLSPFTPLRFTHHKHDGIDGRYIQTFAPTDRILVQAICAPSEPVGQWQLYSEPGHVAIGNLEPSKWSFNESSELQFITLSPAPGLYSLVIGGMQSNVFRVTDDGNILRNTTLIQYSMNNNRHRTDTMFFIDGMQMFFDFRVPGGFKDSGWSFSADGEQFVSDKSDIIQLSGIESTQKKFTLGNSEGCPVWFAELLNRLLCCSYVYFDGERYARKDTSVPEMSVLQDGLNSFVFTQNLQRVINIDPELNMQHQIILRRIGDDNYRLTKTNINRII